jgi:hypothetical protein
MSQMTWSFHIQQLGEVSRECCPSPGEFIWTDTPGREALQPYPAVCSSDETQRLVSAAAQLLIEGLTGRRPFSQLARWLPAHAVARLEFLAHKGTWSNAKIQRTMGAETTPGTIHAVVLIDNASRITAATLRLHQVQALWRCERADLLWAGSHLG